MKLRVHSSPRDRVRIARELCVTRGVIHPRDFTLLSILLQLQLTNYPNWCA